MDSTNPLENPKEEVLPSLTCQICIEPMTKEKKFKNKESCSHPFCLDCIAKYIEAKLVENTAEVPCPAFNCDNLLDPHACRPVLPAGLFVKWCDVLCESTALRCESAYCPFAECSTLVLNECGGNITRSECPNCKKVFCFQCKIPWHAGFECDETEQMRDENDILFGELVERNKWKICPGCKYRVERNEGCYNIKCRCGVLFCYVCGKIKDACDCYRQTQNVAVERQNVAVERQVHTVARRRRVFGADFNIRRYIPLCESDRVCFFIFYYTIFFAVNAVWIFLIVLSYRSREWASAIILTIIFGPALPFQVYFHCSK